MKLTTIVSTMTLALFGAVASSLAQGTAFTYQGRLTDNGSPPSGDYDLRFALYDALSAGNQVGPSLTNRPVAVSNGLFTASLDFGAGVFTGPARWLEISVRTNGSTEDYTTLTPRQAITPAPYAIAAGEVTGVNVARLDVSNSTARQATGVPIIDYNCHCISFAVVTDGGAGYVTPPNVTVYSSTGSGAAITAIISGGSVVALAGGGGGNYYDATLTIDPPPSGYQTFATENFFTRSVHFDPTSGPPFTVASASKVNNLNADLLDDLDSTGFSRTNHTHLGQRWAGYADNYGLNIVFTNSFGEFGAAIRGEELNTLGGVGVSGRCDGRGAYGGIGVSGYGGDYGDGVFGYSKYEFGVHGNSISGIGVYGDSSSGSGLSGSGVYGAGDYGVSGVSPNNIGVFAQNTSSGKVAYLATAGLAADFYGDVYVHGNVTKSGGSFKIDHPLDPANKYLYHSFVESPDMKNIYDGVVMLDDRGEAQIELPKWFDALNKDFRYQLTSIGTPSPNLHVARKVEGDRFRIAGGVAGQEVSWQLTGVRKDAWANAHRIPVEEDKPAQERGSFLAPEEHGQSKEKSVQWARYPEARQQMSKAQKKQPASTRPGGAQ